MDDNVVAIKDVLARHSQAENEFSVTFRQEWLDAENETFDEPHRLLTVGTVHLFDSIRGPATHELSSVIAYTSPMLNAMGEGYLMRRGMLELMDAIARRWCRNWHPAGPWKDAEEVTPPPRL